ncbi:MAG: hypothetical protein F6K58_19920 [Symploca sp. SIO2E9]|nr:hypothetical protein [Symploca sp. SIO2E9]
MIPEDFLNLEKHTINLKAIAFIDWDGLFDNGRFSGACIYFLYPGQDDIFTQQFVVEEGTRDYQILALFFGREIKERK